MPFKWVPNAAEISPKLQGTRAENPTKSEVTPK
jgi:hypothetical protein